MRLCRSHCLLIVHAATTDQATGVRTVGKLTLCDLAGSERINKTGATGKLPPKSGAVPVPVPGKGLQECVALSIIFFPLAIHMRTPR